VYLTKRALSKIVQRSTASLKCAANNFLSQTDQAFHTYIHAKRIAPGGDGSAIQKSVTVCSMNANAM